MKIKYKCHNCGTENIVSILDLANLGMGLGGAMATDLGFGGMMSGGPFAGGGRGMHNLPAEIVHNCSKCAEKNVINVR